MLVLHHSSLPIAATMLDAVLATARKYGRCCRNEQSGYRQQNEECFSHFTRLLVDIDNIAFYPFGTLQANLLRLMFPVFACRSRRRLDVTDTMFTPGVVSQAPQRSNTCAIAAETKGRYPQGTAP